MKTRFLIGTALGLVFATAAFAQSPSGSTTTSPTTQTQTPSTSAPTTQKAPDTSTSQSPPASASTATAPAPSSGPSQAQTTAPAPGGTSAPAQAQTTTPAPANNQAQQAPASSNTTAQPAQPSNPPSNTAQSSSTNVNASININDQQRTRVTESITRLNVQPITNVNFSLSVGTAVPRDIRLQTLPADVVEVVPQYRGYSFFVVRDEIVIVEPSTYQIVMVLPRSGGATAAAPSQSKVSFTDKDRDVVRKHVKTRTDRQTTGSTAKVVIRRGERLPDSVEFEEFPDTVYREAPSLREYRYIHRENRTYLVEPKGRMVIEEID